MVRSDAATIVYRWADGRCGAYDQYQLDRDIPDLPIDVSATHSTAEWEEIARRYPPSESDLADGWGLPSGATLIGVVWLDDPCPYAEAEDRYWQRWLDREADEDLDREADEVDEVESDY